MARRTGSLVQLSERGSVAWCQIGTFQCIPTSRQLTNLDQSLRPLNSLLHGVWQPFLRWRLATTAASSAHFTLATINSCQCPATNSSNLATNLSLPNNPPRGGQCNIILGKSKNNFHPRSCCSTFLLDAPATISSRAILKQIRNDPHKNRGTDLNKQPRCWNNSTKSHSSNCANPSRIIAAEGRTGGTSSSTNNSSCTPSTPASEHILPSSLSAAKLSMSSLFNSTGWPCGCGGNGTSLGIENCAPLSLWRKSVSMVPPNPGCH